MTDTAYRRGVVVLLLAALLILGTGLGLRDPWPADEPRFALIARDMAANGNWLFPAVAGDLYPDKPPLFFWLVAGLYRLLGSIDVALLLPGLFAGLGVLWLITDLGKRLWSPRAGIACGIATLTMLQFPLQMKTGQIDGFLCLLTTVGFYGLCRHLLLGPAWSWYAAAGIAAGLGVITKGVGFLPYLLFLPYAYARISGWRLPHIAGRDARWLLAPLATLSVIGAWLVPMLVAVSASADPAYAAYRDNILFHQTITRYADAWGHVRPPWYLFTHAASWLWLPVTALLPWLVPRWRDELYRRNAAVLLPAGWVLLVLLFFSLSDGKRSVYILPALPALALLAGPWIEMLSVRRGVQAVLLALTLLLAVSFGALGVYALAEPGRLAEWVADPADIRLTTVSIFTIGGLAAFAAAAGRLRSAPWSLPAALALAWLGLGLVVAPAISDVRSGRALVTELKRHVAGDEIIGFVDWPEQFLLHWSGPAIHFGYRRDNDVELAAGAAWAAADPARRLLLPGHLVEPCFGFSGAERIGKAHRREWFLVRGDAASAACPRGEELSQVVVYTPPVRRAAR